MRIKVPYWQIIAVPILLIFSGAASNEAVLIANHGKFPVMLNERQVAALEAKSVERAPEWAISATPAPKQKFSPFNTRVTGDTQVDESGQFIDDVHSIMGKNSRLKALADVFDIGSAIASFGDFLLMLGTWSWQFAPIAWLALVIGKSREN